ncbi:MAG: hypothetical protein DIZ77_08260 [endosymbiont of Seepiophila jonesi]|uniref:Uncharacterized protein n=1 Tax=endosymbiont of Lamellibrachia luymesi TaxID=2200907 RepID=A0A370DRJ9_9GAMM|nr:MAG: hypothetical protein DIZ79_15670 [endosymbiont of Lamellibrachia luymesi]RDH92475.1 MAG: hypothetical protein DIZ77_08260 [endosymbiont of Seepiophila jonesi]
MAETGTALYIFLAVFLFFAGILWILLPFAVFGIKPRLDHQAKTANEKMDLIAELLKAQTEEAKVTNARLIRLEKIALHSAGKKRIAAGDKNASENTDA